MIELRTPNFLSPSSISKFETDRTTFFERYLSPVKVQRPPQEDYMSMGSAFDAFVKSQISIDIFGHNSTEGGQFDREKLFESQVEPHNRDIVWPRAMDLWDQYLHSGAYGSLLGDIAKSPIAPEMEFTARGEIEGVPLLGKPDLKYYTPTMLKVIGDWKVNGSMSNTGASPVQGYQICRDTYGSSTNGKSHKARRLKKDASDKVYKDYTPFDLAGTTINEWFMEDYSVDWADQLSIYSWLLGEPIGSEQYIIRMEQISCRPVKTQPLPRAKFATHMSRISKGYQESVLARVKMCWSTIESGHIFTDVSKESSDEICEQLVAKAKTPPGLHPALSECLTTSVRFK